MERHPVVRRNNGRTEGRTEGENWGRVGPGESGRRCAGGPYKSLRLSRALRIFMISRGARVAPSAARPSPGSGSGRDLRAAGSSPVSGSVLGAASCSHSRSFSRINKSLKLSYSVGQDSEVESVQNQALVCVPESQPPSSARAALVRPAVRAPPAALQRALHLAPGPGAVAGRPCPPGRSLPSPPGLLAPPPAAASSGSPGLAGLAAVLEERGALGPLLPRPPCTAPPASARFSPASPHGASPNTWRSPSGRRGLLALPSSRLTIPHTSVF